MRTDPVPPRRPLVRHALRAAVAVATLAAIGLGAALLHDRAGAGVAANEPTPIGLRTLLLRPEPGYAEPRRFAGRVEPARSAALAFERAGRVDAVLVDEGARVTAGQPLARLDTAALATERARLAAVRRQLDAAVELARVTAERQAALTDRAASGQRRDETRLALAEAEARRAEIEAQIARVALEIDRSTLRAPFAGRIAERRIDEGAIADPGAPALTLLETSRPRARIGLPPDLAATLAPGDRHDLAVGGATRPARLVALRPDIDPASRTVAALFELDGDAPAPFGDLAVLALDIPRAAPGAWVPLTALVEGSRGTWTVYALAEDPGASPEPTATIAREAVEILTVDGERAFVRTALPPSARIVADGTHRVRPGQRVPLQGPGEPLPSARALDLAAE
jgi:membrane fusion protein, multidrug efflux system